MWQERIEILIADEDRPFADALEEILRPLGLDLRRVPGLHTLRTPASQLPDFVIFGFEDAQSLDLPALRVALEPLVDVRAVVILPPGSESYDHLIREAGARAVIARNLGPRHVAQWIVTQAEICQLERQNQKLSQMLDGRMSYENLLGGSPPMRALYRLLDQVARTDAPVLVTGEEGTERVEIARAVHQKSARGKSSVVVVDCAECAADPRAAAIFGPLGHGSHPFGPHSKTSAFARAGKGSVVLHRIELLHAEAQRRLLEFLHHPFFQDETPGTPQPLARLMTTSGPNLLGRVESGQFDRELFYRLNILQVRVPPLRERREDIPLLAQHYLREASGPGRTRPQGNNFSSQALLALFQYDWPGNLEELREMITHLADTSRGPRVELSDLPDELNGGGADQVQSRNTTGLSAMPLKEAKRKFETEYFKGLLRRTQGNMTMASRYSRVGRPYLYKKMREYGIEPEQFR